MLASIPTSTSKQSPRWLQAFLSKLPGCLGVAPICHWWGCSPDSVQKDGHRGVVHQLPHAIRESSAQLVPRELGVEWRRDAVCE
eukprot:2828905-Pyramimonas_sp.AAC.1